MFECYNWANSGAGTETTKTKLNYSSWCDNREFYDHRGKHTVTCGKKWDPKSNRYVYNHPRYSEHEDRTWDYCSDRWYHRWDQVYHGINVQCSTKLFCGYEVTKEEADTHHTV